MAAAVPGWLRAVFPGHDWQKVCRVALAVGPEGAGLQLEATELGYLVEGVDAAAGQDGRLRSGCVLVEIEGVPLLGLDEDALDEAFGQQFRAGAAVLAVDAAELRAAAEAGRGQLLRVPLGCGCGPELRSKLEPDLAMLASRADVVAELCSGGVAGTPFVLLAGGRVSVSSARAELGALLAYHRRGGDAAPGGEADTATVEVGGTVMRSLPARGRRRRAAPAADDGLEDAATGDGAAQDAAAGDGAGPPEKRGKVAAAPCASPSGPELQQYEYMDHTADVILHSWGTSLEEAIGQVCVCFFSYMTDLEKLTTVTSFEVEATGHDMLDMLYHLLDEFLFHFGTEFIMCRRVEILELDQVKKRVRARGFGEKFDLAKHTQGTEIKAITMHQMKILTPDTVTTEEGVRERTSDNMEGGKVKAGFPFECYVLVDI